MSSLVKGNHTTPGITNNPRLDDRSELLNPRVTALSLTPQPSPSSNIQPTNDIPSLPILSPDLNIKPPKLARWIIWVFSLDLVFMILVGILLSIGNDSYLVIVGSISIWIGRIYTCKIVTFGDRVVVSKIKLWTQRRERKDVKGKSTVKTVANIRDNDATQAGAFSVSLKSLSLPRRQDTEATVGMVPAESSN